MALYIMLSTLSETGRKVVRKLPGSIRKVNEEVGRMGVRVVAQYAVLGPYDFVTVVEAPDNETIAKVSMELRRPRVGADDDHGGDPRGHLHPASRRPAGRERARRVTPQALSPARGTWSKPMAARGPSGPLAAQGSAAGAGTRKPPCACS